VTRALRIVFIPLLLAAVPEGADALTLLTAGKRAVLTPAGARIRVGADRALRDLADPTVCAPGASIEIAGYPSATGLVTGGQPAALPCERWRRMRDGYRYRDDDGTAGGVRRVVYSRHGIDVRIAGNGWTPVPGPVGFVQMWLRVGERRYLVRFHALRENGAARIVARRPSALAAAGEAAFWDTLWGDADRETEALRLLDRAGQRDRHDARSAFLAGMMRLHRFGRSVIHYPAATPEQAADIEVAQALFDRAAPLLWSMGSGDSRVPGFSGGTRFVLGVLRNDPALVARARSEIADAAERNPLFNTFIPLGSVPPIAAPQDADYREVLRLLDEYFPVAITLCGTQKEICFNEGMAPHNLEGTFTLFGDVYAKGQRVEQARSFYGQAIALGERSGWRADFLASARERLGTVDARAARWADADRSNDPPLLGVANGTCAYCHVR
jgi:hypothetical protein